MAHIDCPYLNSDGTVKKYVFQDWTFGLRQLGFKHRSETGKLITFYQGGRFEGSFTIPVQIARLQSGEAWDDAGILDDTDDSNTKRHRRNVQAWIDALNDGFNTSDLPLDEPTINPPSTWNPTPRTPEIDGEYCKISVPHEGSWRPKAGLLAKFGSPARVYRISKITSTDWYLVPGVLPKGTIAAPQKVTSIKFRMVNHQGQTLRQATRGPWQVEWEEVVE